MNAQKIVSETANVVDSKIRNYSEFVTTYPQRNWFDNVGFEVKEVVLTDGGSGWTNAPRVVMSGGGGPTVIGSTTINEGKVTGIVIDFANLRYITAPTLTFEGDQGEYSTNKPARATAIIGNGPVRATHMLIKFDRVAGAYVVTDLNVTQNFTGTGSQIDFILKWPMDVRPANTKITVNNFT